MRHVIVGWDERETTAFAVCKHSLIRRASVPVDVFPLMEQSLRFRKLFTRPQENYVDLLDGKPFSTEFSFTRFLVPEICRMNNIGGWVLFCDSDFLFLDDVETLFTEVEHGGFGELAVMVTKHNYSPADSTKMDGMKQESYPRKLWSSFVMWNMDHPANKKLTEQEVNTRPGSWLHNFSWLEDSEIGSISELWNWVPNVSPTYERYYAETDAKAIHFSLGTPDMPGYEDVPFAQHWRNELAHLKGPYPQRETIRL